MAKDSRRQVAPDKNGGWDVKPPDAARASAHTNAQAEAAQRAREIVHHAGGRGRCHARQRLRDPRAKRSVSQGDAMHHVPSRRPRLIPS